MSAISLTRKRGKGMAGKPSNDLQLAFEHKKASGDIGFVPKASDTNGLRVVEQQYLHQKPNISYGFMGRSSDGTLFSSKFEFC